MDKPLDWRGEKDTTPEDDDDDLLDATPDGVAAVLGFDPLEFDGAEDAQPDLPEDTNEDGDDDEPEAHTPSGLVDALGFDPLDLMAEDAIEDKEGHHHSESDGKFVSKGGGGGPAGEHVSAAKAAASKSVREGLRKLFKTGHSFSVKELSEILELPEKTIKTALAHIKNPKKATAKFSTLELVQDPATKQYSLKQMTEAAQKAQQSASAPSQSQESWGIPEIAKAPDVKMSESDANFHYSEQMAESANTLYWNSQEGYPYEKAMLKWKMSRAYLMAQWKANTTGEDVKPIPQQLYQADKLLWDAVQADSNWSDALAAWKQNTAAEKKGQLAKAEPEYTSTAPVYESPDAANYKDLNHIPASFKQIGKDQFKGNINHTEYYKGFTETHQKFSKGSDEAVENKIVIQKDIEARLKNSAAFQKLQTAYANSKNKNGEGALVRRLVSAWAGSSGDHSQISAYMQHMVADVFGMQSGDLSMGHVQSRSGAQSNITQALGVPGYPVKDLDAGLKDFVRAQYDNTQEFLKQRGIKEVYVARGMKIGSSKGKAEEINLKLQPASSFSHSHYTASSFAGDGTVYMVKVPAAQVLGSYRTGYGCTNEQEVTLLAAPKMKAIAIGKSKAATADQAINAIKNELEW